MPHAIGGALALAYYGVPQVTVDIDLNVFVSTDHWPEIRGALEPLGLDLDPDVRELNRDKEVRLDWDRNQVHLFFSHDELHVEMPAAIREVPFAETTIPIVGPEHLIIRKATLDRPKDWLDIEAVLVATEPLDVEEIESWLRRVPGERDPRVTKMRDLISRVST